MTRLWIVVTALSLVLITGSVSACGPIPAASLSALQQVLDRSDGVYVVTLVSSRLRNAEISTWDQGPTEGSIDAYLDRARASARQLIEYEFRVLEVIHGDDVETVTVQLPHRRLTANNTHFDRHRDITFWEDDGNGRAMISGDCSVVANFRYGDTYILLRSDPWHVKSFERVTSRDDQFYQFLIAHFQ